MKGVSVEKWSLQKSPFSIDSGEFRDSRDSRECPDCGKQRRVRPFSRLEGSREIRDFRDSGDDSTWLDEKTAAAVILKIFTPLASRLSFCYRIPGPQRVPGGFLKGSLHGSRWRLSRVRRQDLCDRVLWRIVCRVKIWRLSFQKL